jgi:ABC-2 type transport system permease protein
VAGLSTCRDQLRAIVFLRWRLFANSLRSVRGRLNLVSRSLMGLLVAGAAIGGAVAAGFAAWGLEKEGKPEWLALPFWLIFLFWQLFPIMATAFTYNVDTSALLRFPLSYAEYLLVRLVLGALDIATALGISWSVGLYIGVIAADSRITPWALAAVVCFILFNLLFARMVFVWLEHWLSSRRSKEVMGVAVLLMMIGFQVAGPVLERYSRQPASNRFHAAAKFLPAEKALPPGLAAASVGDAGQKRNLSALVHAALVLAYAGAALWLVHLRLHEQYRGENPSGGEELRTGVTNSAAVRRGWRLPVFSGAISAVFEKELRYFSRSGPMLFTLIMPVIMVFLLWGGRRALVGQQPQGFVFPVGAAYCLLVMTNILYNSFGGDGGGVQFYLFSPIPFRQVSAAKNLAHLFVLGLNVSILWMGVSMIFHPPRLRVVALTFAWLLFAAPVNFAVGNVLSVYSPKRIEYSTFGRQRASETTILISLAVQLAVIAIGALAVYIANLYRNLWVAVLILLLLAVGSIAAYFVSLARLDRLALERREVLTGELCQT